MFSMHCLVSYGLELFKTFDHNVPNMYDVFQYDSILRLLVHMLVIMNGYIQNLYIITKLTPVKLLCNLSDKLQLCTIKYIDGNSSILGRRKLKTFVIFSQQFCNSKTLLQNVINLTWNKKIRLYVFIYPSQNIFWYLELPNLQYILVLNRTLRDVSSIITIFL